MKQAIIEIDKSLAAEMSLLEDLDSTSIIQKIEPKRFTGTIEVVILVIKLTSATIGLISSYYAYKKIKGTKTITIDDKEIILEELSEKEIRELLEKLMDE